MKKYKYIILLNLLLITSVSMAQFGDPIDEELPEVPINGSTWTLVGAGVLFSAYFLFRNKKQQV